MRDRERVRATTKGAACATCVKHHAAAGERARTQGAPGRARGRQRGRTWCGGAPVRAPRGQHGHMVVRWPRRSEHTRSAASTHPHAILDERAHARVDFLLHHRGRANSVTARVVDTRVGGRKVQQQQRACSGAATAPRPRRVTRRRGSTVCACSAQQRRAPRLWAARTRRARSAPHSRRGNRACVAEAT